MPNSSETNFPWLNVVQYPFLTREFDAGDGWISYVDHGRGRPVVFLHGNPTWSYLYRHLIRDLGRNFRCIAPDMLGYGLSDKPRKADYRPEAQADRFERLMDYLQLDDITLVVQCAGGPIGLSWAMNNLKRIHSLVLFNTWMWPLDENIPARQLSRLVGNPLNRLYYRFLPASPTFILPALFADRHNLARATKVQYLEPFRMYKDRMALYAMIEGLLESREWFERLWEARELLSNTRALLLWGMKDPLFGEASLEQFETVFRNHETQRIPTCGRFVPEEEAKLSVEAMRWFLMNHMEKVATL